MIRPGLFVILALAILLAGCDRFPDSYPPPQQRQSLDAFGPGAEAMMVEMSDPHANLHIVKDIYNPGSAPWRWSGQNPTVRILAVTPESLKFRADFAIWNDSFKITGPVDITFLVNGRPFDKIRYTSPGDKHFEKPIPDDWISAGTETTLALSVDKLYTSPNDGNKFGVILVRMGLSK
ncbi:MAG TPA: hypothetical protein VFW44_18040 [Bryobacteraceae bacterium]|nr:hypothetical protein [Bryobacteraceae bacterium]